jgi:hypothetical protein
VLPAHRADAFLVEAIRSVEHAIGDDPAELIVVANGPDCGLVAEAVHRIRTLPQTRVELSDFPSLIHCLNRGIELARGEYIARFDSDDVCLPDRFRRQYALAVSSNADFVFSDAEVIDTEGRPTGETKAAAVSLWKRCGPIHPTAFMRRDALLRLGGYGNLEYSEDYHLWLRAFGDGYRFEVDHRPAIRYRVHGQQTTDRSKLTDTFATNIGIKLIVGLRKRKLSIFLGALADSVYLIYRKCRAAFS